MSGKPDPLYVRARAVLLDAAEALHAHLDAVVLVGAQALYLHTGSTDFPVAEYTTDADFTIGPGDLADSPLIAELMEAGGFERQEDLGRWLSSDGVFVDLMVPDALAGAGTRGARLGPHGKRVARRARGLEAALVDNDVSTIEALDQADHRRAQMKVAGPGALLVAKVHKISERADRSDRLRDKDALDVFRLLQAVDTLDLVRSLEQLRREELSAEVTSEAIDLLDPFFGRADAMGVKMVGRAAGPAADAEVVAASVSLLVQDLLACL